MPVGVLALQGSFREHLAVLDRLGVDSLPVKTPAELEAVSALIIPGGESTVIADLAQRNAVFEPIKQRIAAGMPVYGTCAGMIMLAGRIADSQQLTLGALEITVRRNAFGSQTDSFEGQIPFADMQVEGVFIRAPWVEKVGTGVQVLSTLADGTIVGVRQGSILATSFHPELTDDTRVHEFFLGFPGVL